MDQEMDQQVPSREHSVRYMQRTRDYYRALGYSKDYVWAYNEDVPFTHPRKPLAEMRLGLVTTTSPAGFTRQSVPKVWSGDASVVPQSLFTGNLAWDKESTHTRDTETFLPLKALNKLVAASELGAIGPRYHGIPTEYSQRQTTEQDAPEVLARLREDQVDAVLLVPL